MSDEIPNPEDFDDNNILAIAMSGSTQITFVTVPPNALNGNDIAAFPTFDDDRIVVAINETAVSPLDSIEDRQRRIMELLEEGIHLATDILDS